MGNFTHQFNLPAPGAERPDFTIISFPAANVADVAGEEIELDQALSLAGRFGRDLLGVNTQRVLESMATEHLTITTADHEMAALIRLQTRTGSTFSLSDPELLWRARWHAVVAAGATPVDNVVFNPGFYETLYGEPELYVAPRLFWRFDNDMDAQINADAWDGRVSSMSRKLTFQLFVELLERYADVTLL